MRLKPIFAAAGAALAAVAAAADDVRFERAALADPAAAAALYEAVEREAERVCRKQYDHVGALGPTARRRAVEACVEETVEAALAAADLPALVGYRVASRD